MRLPIKYLDISLGDKFKEALTWGPVINLFESRLSSIPISFMPVATINSSWLGDWKEANEDSCRVIQNGEETLHLVAWDKVK